MVMLMSTMWVAACVDPTAEHIMFAVGVVLVAGADVDAAARRVGPAGDAADAAVDGASCCYSRPVSKPRHFEDTNLKFWRKRDGFRV